MSKIVTDEQSIINTQIESEKLNLNKTDQTRWKEDMVKYLYSFNKIEELNKGNFYKDELLKPQSFLRTLFHIKETGIGRGEIMLCYMFEKAKASGGGLSYDVVLLNGITYEVKDYVRDKGSIRLGTEGKLGRYNFWEHIKKSVNAGEEIYHVFNKELKDNIQPFYFKIWGYIADDKQKGRSYNKAISAGVMAGELSDANLNILKMWYYLSHELITMGKNKLDLPEEIFNRLSRLEYINKPEQLDKDLDTAAEQYFNQNPELDLFIVFRSNKVNIANKKDFSFKTITQAAVKFLENELSNKDIHIAKTAFDKWKKSIEKTSNEMKDIEDKKTMKEIIKGTTYLDFYNEAQDIEFEKKFTEKKKNKHKKNLTVWKSKRATLDKNLKKMKKPNAIKAKKAKWIKDNPKPVLKESFYPQLFGN